ncbi:MAG TPA: hypothetical protein VFF98_09105 [Novosphingobium sp.]|nr:hypothetical protein [Novosphingobium sp.]HZV08949.1 hypothetical protein [Novosphingobium sp.]
MSKAPRPSALSAEPTYAGAPTARELRAQAVQRLQVGLFGLALMLLLVGLANIIMDHARQNETAAGAAIAVSSASSASGGSTDPLADIGVVPSPDADPAAHRPTSRTAPTR